MSHTAQGWCGGCAQHEEVGQGGTPMPDVAVVEPAANIADADAFLTAITALLPDIHARAGETERAGRVSDDVVKALTDIGVFRAVQPRQWGGLELDLATFYEGMILIASACASTGWVASVVVLCTDRLGAPGQRRFPPVGPLALLQWRRSLRLGAAGRRDTRRGNGAEFRTFLVPRSDFVVDH